MRALLEAKLLLQYDLERSKRVQRAGKTANSHSNSDTNQNQIHQNHQSQIAHIQNLFIEDQLYQYVNFREKFFRIHDTCEIVQVFMLRPASLALRSLGQWFNSAHILGDKNLELAASSQETKLIICMERYNLLSLEPLREYNAAWKNKGEERN